MVGIALGVVSWIPIGPDRSTRFWKKPMNPLVPVHRTLEGCSFEDLNRRFLDKWEPTRWKRLDPCLGS